MPVYCVKEVQKTDVPKRTTLERVYKWPDPFKRVPVLVNVASHACVPPSILLSDYSTRPENRLVHHCDVLGVRKTIYKTGGVT